MHTAKVHPRQRHCGAACFSSGDNFKPQAPNSAVLVAFQVLFLNLMSDGCPAVALAKEPPDGDNMSVRLNIYLHTTEHSIM